MSSVALSGADTISINNTPILDLADGNCIELTFPNDIANVKTGKNGNSIFGINESGRQCESKLRILRASVADKFLNSLLAVQLVNPTGFALLIGQFLKKISDGGVNGNAPNITSDSYVMSGGIFIKIPEAKDNVEGETDQSIATYTIKWANAVRLLR